MPNRYREEVKAILIRGYKENAPPDVVQLWLLPLLAKCIQDAGEDTPYVTTIDAWNKMVLDIIIKFIACADDMASSRTLN
jgi:hypothetical protein